ncbi:MAG: hypothetical protein EOP89_14895, partial [Lysobacteraceae bacterium]
MPVVWSVMTHRPTPAPDRLQNGSILSGAGRSPDGLPCALAVLDMLPGLVAYFDRDLTYRFANATYAAWRGIGPDQI